jgi:hypothetical protein
MNGASLGATDNTMPALFVTLTDSKHLFKENLTLSWNGGIIRRGRSFGHGSAFQTFSNLKRRAKILYPVSHYGGRRKIVRGGKS